MIKTDRLDRECHFFFTNLEGSYYTKEEEKVQNREKDPSLQRKIAFMQIKIGSKEVN